MEKLFRTLDDFCRKGTHKVRKSNAKNRYGERRISFTIEGVDFKLVWVEALALKYDKDGYYHYDGVEVIIMV